MGEHNLLWEECRIVYVCACVPAVKGVLTLGDLIVETAKPVNRRGLCCFQMVAG